VHQERENVGEVTLDRQHTTEICEHCRGPIAVSRGSVHDDGDPSGLYVAGMHRCDVLDPRESMKGTPLSGADADPAEARQSPLRDQFSMLPTTW
jgi:hypothetical protein